jgi:hypothetical protein
LAYEKGNYDDLRRDLQSVQWDTLIIENDVNQSVTNVTNEYIINEGLLVNTRSIRD